MKESEQPRSMDAGTGREGARLSRARIEAMTPGEMRQALHELHARQVETEKRDAELRLRLEHPDHSAAAFFEITMRKEAEEALLASQRFIEGIINAMPVRVFWKNLDLVYLGCNTAFAHDAGFAGPQDIIGKDDYQLVWRAQADAYRRDDRQVIESGTAKLLIEEPQTTPAGTTLWLLTSKLPMLDAAGSVSGVLGTYMDITVRKQAEELLAGSEKKYRAIIDGSPVPMALNDDRRNITFLNQAFIRLFGYTLEDIPTLEQWWQKAYPDSGYRQWVASTWLARLEHARSHGAEFQPMEVTVRCGDGSDKVILASAAATSNELEGEHLVSLYDITGRKSAEELVRQSEEKFRLAFMTGPDAFYIATLEEGRIRDINRVFEDLWGYQRHEVIGRTAIELGLYCDPADRAALLAELKARGFVRDMELQGRKKDGTPIIISLCVSVMQADSQEYVLGCVRDITERRRTDMALRAALAEKSSLVREIHHRVKNNLAIMASLINMQVRQIRHPDALAALADTKSRLFAMSLLHDMLYSSGRMDRVEVKGYLDSLCCQLAQSLGMAAHGITITCRAPAALALDPDQAVPCGLIVSELVTNAVKHAFPGDTAGTVTVELEAAPAGDIILRVGDNGMGLPDSVMIDHADGVGLSLVNALTRQLDGALEIRRGQGTLFEIRFPFRREETNIE